MDIDKVAKAIERDAGIELPDLKTSLKEMEKAMSGRNTTEAQLLVRSARKEIGLSQSDFAHLINTPVATLRDWEQGRFAPSGAVLCLLALLNKNPVLANELADH